MTNYNEKWKELHAKEMMALGKTVGRTIKAVTIDSTQLEITLDDGSIIDIGCYVDQRSFSDVAELALEMWPPTGDSDGKLESGETGLPSA